MNEWVAANSTEINKMREQKGIRLLIEDTDAEIRKRVMKLDFDVSSIVCNCNRLASSE